jgi:hypothetical protein
VTRAEAAALQRSRRPRCDDGATEALCVACPNGVQCCLSARPERLFEKWCAACGAYGHVSRTCAVDRKEVCP